MSQAKGGGDTPATPDSGAPMRKRFPFIMVGRGVAGVDEMAECLDDTKVFFGLLQIQVGSGSFARTKNIFIHFNGENHPKPMQRAKANKKLKLAAKMLSPWHAQLTLQSVSECSVDNIFSQFKGLFVADNMGRGDLAKLKNEYKEKMERQRLKAAEAKKRLEEAKRKLLARQEAEEKADREAEEAAARKKEEEERLRREEEERKRKEEEERLRREAEEEAERQRLAEEEARRIAEEEEKKRQEEEEEAKRQAEEEEHKRKEAEEAKKKKRRKKRKKDDWSNDRPWTGPRIVKCIHQQTSPMNWAIFAPSTSEIIPLAFGHGDLNSLRDALRDDMVQYGIIRLTFGAGRFKRSHWVMLLWTPDSMTKDVPQKVRSKRQSERMSAVNMRGEMERLIGPYGILIVAEDYQKITLEECILRVRRTVAVDGSDDFMNAESLARALEEERAHFEALEAARKAKADEEAAKNANAKPDYLRDEPDDETPGVETPAAKEPEAPPKAEEERPPQAEAQEEPVVEKLTVEGEVPAEEAGAETPVPDDVPQPTGPPEPDAGEMPKGKPAISIDMPSTEDASALVTPKKGRRRAMSIDPAVIQEREMQSTLAFESVQLVHREDEDLVWVLLEPRLPGSRN